MSFIDSLKNFDAKNLLMSNNRTLGDNLYNEAKRLYDCIQNSLEMYLAFNPPEMYKRTGGLEGSLTVDDFLNIRVVGNTLEVDLFFDEGAIHRSGDGINGWNGNDEKVNTAFLLEYGYRVKKDVWFKNIENFGWRNGARFVEKGIADFNATNPLGIKVIVKSNGYLV